MHPPDSSKQSTVTFLLQDIHGLVGESGTGALEVVVTGVQLNETELEVQRRGKGFEDPTASLSIDIVSFIRMSWFILPLLRNIAYRNDFPSDTVTGDETCKEISVKVQLKGGRRQLTDAKSPGSGHGDFFLCFDCGGAGRGRFLASAIGAGFVAGGAKLIRCIDGIAHV